MKLTRKHFIIAGVVIFAVTAMSFVRAKFNQGKEVLKKIIISVNFPKRIRIADSSLKFDVDITLKNPTSFDFTASSGGYIRAEGFRLYKGNTLLSSGQLGNIQNIDLYRHQTHTIRDISVEISLKDLGMEVANMVTGGNGIFGLLQTAFEQGGITNLIDKAKNIDWKKELTDCTIEIDIHAFGQKYEYRQKFT